MSPQLSPRMIRSNSWRRSLFAEYEADHIAHPIDGYETQRLGCVTRYLPLDHKHGGAFLAFTRLPQGEERSLIREQVAFFQERGKSFEWKTYGFDEPNDLPELLRAERFVADSVEALLVFPSLRALRKRNASKLRGIEFRKAVVGDATLADVVKVQEAVWKRSFHWLEAHLYHALEARGDDLLVFCAYARSRPVGSGWITFRRASRFAELHGGAVLDEMRGRGIYSELFRARADEARRRDCEFLAVDASPMSRPILESKGFDYICDTCPMQFSTRNFPAATGPYGDAFYLRRQTS